MGNKEKSEQLCGKKFERYSRNVKSKKKHGQTDFYCDKSCAGKHFGNHRPKETV